MRWNTRTYFAFVRLANHSDAARGDGVRCVNDLLRLIGERQRALQLRRDLQRREHSLLALNWLQNQRGHTYSTVQYNKTSIR